jgi:hypothetical protein
VLTTPTLGVASATSLNTSGMATSSSLTVTSLTSALLLTNANGTAAEYVGTACTGTQTIRSLSALGVATCGSGALATSTALAANQIVYGTAANTIGSEAAFTYNASTNTFAADNVVANTGFFADINDGATLGSSTRQFSDLYLASGALIDFANGNSVITHSSGILTVSTGDLRVTTAGTNAASVVTVGGTQTLTAKTLTTPTISSPSITGTATTSNLYLSGRFLDTSASAGTNGYVLADPQHGNRGNKLAANSKRQCSARSRSDLVL